MEEKCTAEAVLPEEPAAAPEETAQETEPQPSETTAPEQDITRVTSEMWQYHPVPEDEPEPFPEYLVSSKTYPHTSIIGARVRGKKHKHEGTNCDDWFETASSGIMTCVAAADGAGSKKYSRIGAKAACQTAVGYLMHTFTRWMAEEPTLPETLQRPMEEDACIAACQKMAGMMQEAVLKARSAVESAFYSRKADPAYQEASMRDLSSTFLIAVILSLSEETKEKLVLSLQIGDGMIAILNTKESYGNAVKLMGEPDSGDFSGETDFLVNTDFTDPQTLARRTKLYRGCADLLLIMTDGVADDYFPYEEQMHRLYLDLVANGILEPECNVPANQLSSRQLDLIRSIPDPTGYPWVNDHSVQIPLHYTKTILQATGLTLEELWEEKTIVSIAAAAVKEGMSCTDPAERMKLWLDNYVERGSFDDRTLVAVKI